MITLIIKLLMKVEHISHALYSPLRHHRLNRLVDRKLEQATKLQSIWWKFTAEQRLLMLSAYYEYDYITPCHVAHRYAVLNLPRDLAINMITSYHQDVRSQSERWPDLGKQFRP